MKQTCILVLGMHRSGTSALSGVLNILDVYLGSDLMKPHKDVNPKGFYENTLVYEVNEKLLNKIGSSWDDAFYNEEKLNGIKDVSELEKVLKEEFQNSQIFAIKDPRLTYLFPLYTEALSNLGVEIKIIVPFRHPLEVASSLKARNHFSQEKGLLLWAYHFLLSEKLSRDYPRVFTCFDELVQSPQKVIGLIDQKLELNLISNFESKEKLIHDFLTPDLKHHNALLESLSENLPTIIREIVGQLPYLNEIDLTEQLDFLRNQLFGGQTLFYNSDILNALEELVRSKKKLTKSKQGLQAKDEELAQAKRELLAKDQGLAQAKQELQRKDQELAQARRELQAKDKEIALLKMENAKLNNEILSLYLSWSWRITRSFRSCARRIKKMESFLSRN